jgi:hypothetical protein
VIAGFVQFNLQTGQLCSCHGYSCSDAWEPRNDARSGAFVWSAAAPRLGRLVFDFAAISAVPRRSRAGALGVSAHDFKSQRAGDRRGFHQPNLNVVAESIAFSRAARGQSMRRFIVTEIFAAESRRRNEAVRACVQQSHEQSRTRHAGNARVESRADERR